MNRSGRRSARPWRITATAVGAAALTILSGCGGNQSDNPRFLVIGADGRVEGTAAGTAPADAVPVGEAQPGTGPPAERTPVAGSAAAAAGTGAPSAAARSGTARTSAGATGASASPSAPLSSATGAATRSASPGAAPGTTRPGTAAAPTPGPPAGSAAGGGGATDPGVTAGEIKVGSIGSLSGPLAGLFGPSLEATQAYLNMVNETGGVAGRRIRLIVRDDGLDGTKNLAAAKRLVEDDKVFAIVGQTSPVQDSSGKYMNDLGIPNVGVNGAVGNSGGLYDKAFPTLGGSRPGVWTTTAAKFGSQYGKRCGILDLTIAVSQAAGAGSEAACKALGLDIAYHETVQVAQPDFTAEVARMRANNVDFLITQLDTAANIRLLQAMRRQNFVPHPILNSGYDKATADAVGDVLGRGGAVLTFGPVIFETKGNAEVDLIKATLQKYYPNTTPTIWSVYGWQAGILFTDALKRLGPDVTRARLVDALNGFVKYDFHGTNYPITMRFAERTQFLSCSPLATFRNGTWEQLAGTDFCGTLVKF